MVAEQAAFVNYEPHIRLTREAFSHRSALGNPIWLHCGPAGHTSPFVISPNSSVQPAAGNGRRSSSISRNMLRTKLRGTATSAIVYVPWSGVVAVGKLPSGATATSPA